MKQTILLVLVISASVLLAQDNNNGGLRFVPAVRRTLSKLPPHV